MSFNIYFIRHGETDYNLEHRIQGQCDKSSNPRIKDISLNDKGRLQAICVAEFLNKKGINFNVILSSPLIRAVETAEIIAKSQSIACVIKDDSFRENFSGANYEGMVIDDFKSIKFNPPLEFQFYGKEGSYHVNDGKEMRAFYENSDSIYNFLSNPGGERKIDVKLRVKNALIDFMNKNKEAKNICIACHKIMMKFFLEDISKDPIKSIENGEIFHVTYDGAFIIKNRFNVFLS